MITAQIKVHFMGDAINVVIGRRAREEFGAQCGGGHVKPSNRQRVARKRRTVTLSPRLALCVGTRPAQRHTWEPGYRRRYNDDGGLPHINKLIIIEPVYMFTFEIFVIVTHKQCTIITDRIE